MEVQVPGVEQAVQVDIREVQDPHYAMQEEGHLLILALTKITQFRTDSNEGHGKVIITFLGSANGSGNFSRCWSINQSFFGGFTSIMECK